MRRAQSFSETAVHTRAHKKKDGYTRQHQGARVPSPRSLNQVKSITSPASYAVFLRFAGGPWSVEEDAPAPDIACVPWLACTCGRDAPATRGIVPGCGVRGVGATARARALPLGASGLATPVLEAIARLVLDPLAAAALAFAGGVWP